MHALLRTEDVHLGGGDALQGYLHLDQLLALGPRVLSADGHVVVGGEIVGRAAVVAVNSTRFFVWPEGRSLGGGQ